MRRLADRSLLRREGERYRMLASIRERREAGSLPFHDLPYDDEGAAACSALADELAAHETLEEEQIQEAVQPWLTQA